MKYIENIKNEDGFTLVEILIAMIIFAVGLLAVAQMQIRSLHANSDAFAQTEATMWATNKAEELIALPFTNAALTAASYGPEAHGKYSLNWIITDNPSGVTNTKNIAITVSYTEKGNDFNLTFNYVKGQQL